MKARSLALLSGMIAVAAFGAGRVAHERPRWEYATLCITDTDSAASTITKSTKALRWCAPEVDKTARHEVDPLADPKSFLLRPDVPAALFSAVGAEPPNENGGTMSALLTAIGADGWKLVDCRSSHSSSRTGGQSRVDWTFIRKAE